MSTERVNLDNYDLNDEYYHVQCDARKHNDKNNYAGILKYSRKNNSYNAIFWLQDAQFNGVYVSGYDKERGNSASVILSWKENSEYGKKVFEWGEALAKFYNTDPRAMEIRRFKNVKEMPVVNPVKFDEKRGEYVLWVGITPESFTHTKTGKTINGALVHHKSKEGNKIIKSKIMNFAKYQFTSYFTDVSVELMGKKNHIKVKAYGFYTGNKVREITNSGMDDIYKLIKEKDTEEDGTISIDDMEVNKDVYSSSKIDAQILAGEGPNEKPDISDYHQDDNGDSSDNEELPPAIKGPSPTPKINTPNNIVAKNTLRR
jgi:hypothetical protein